LSKANALAPNWGQTIFQSADQIAANTVLRNRLNEIQAQTQAEKEWWEKRRASIQTDLMKEINTPATPAAKSVATPSKSTSDEDAVIVENPTVSGKGSTKKKKGKK
jgi:translocation protein SEC66